MEPLGLRGERPPLILTPVVADRLSMDAAPRCGDIVVDRPGLLCVRLRLLELRELHRVDSSSSSEMPFSSLRSQLSCDKRACLRCSRSMSVESRLAAAAFPRMSAASGIAVAGPRGERAAIGIIGWRRGERENDSVKLSPLRMVDSGRLVTAGAAAGGASGGGAGLGAGAATSCAASASASDSDSVSVSPSISGAAAGASTSVAATTGAAAGASISVAVLDRMLALFERSLNRCIAIMLALRSCIFAACDMLSVRARSTFPAPPWLSLLLLFPPPPASALH